MKDQEIINASKSIFGVCLALGTIFLLGGLMTRMVQFALGCYMLLTFGAILNLMCVLGLLIYGLVNQTKLKVCLKAIGILCINIPIAFLYTVIGCSLFT